MLAGASLAFSLWLAFAVAAAETAPATPPGTSGKAEPPQEGETEASLLTMLRHSVPGKPHALLERMVGSWTTRTRYCMKPGTETVEANGASTRRWILGGRFLLEEFEGGDLGLPFRGLALLGYDAFEAQYTSVWADTTSTAVLINRGHYDATNRQVSFVGEYKDPWTGLRKKCRGVTRFSTPNETVLELYVTEPEGLEFKMLEITYTRREPAVAPPAPTPPAPSR